MRKFLTIRHWQLFLILVVIPFMMNFIIILPSVFNYKIMVATLPLLIMIPISLFLTWFYALGTNLHKKLPQTITMNLKRFKVLIFIPILYILALLLLIGVLLNISSGNLLNPIIFVLIFPAHFFSMFCIFYCIYFNAKILKTVEWQKPVTFSDFAGEFFLIWFFPIGIWIIQPRINKLFEITDENSDDDVFDNK